MPEYLFIYPLVKYNFTAEIFDHDKNTFYQQLIDVYNIF